MSLLQPIVAGIAQGLTEWLPVSSEGVITVVSALFFGESLAGAIAWALWLHLGTAVSALVALRGDILTALRGDDGRRLRWSPLATYLVIATVLSGAVGLPLLWGLTSVPPTVGGVAMALVGTMMLVTALLQATRPQDGSRSRDALSVRDGIVVGLAQGFAILPGMSRSGLTVAMLLWMGIDKREALIISFLMSIPASIGAAAYVALTEPDVFTSAGVLAAAVAALVGIASIRAFLALAQRVNFALFVAAMGVAVLIGAGIQFWVEA